MKTFECKDVGVNCGWKCQGESEQEILQQVEEHGRKVHGMQQLDPELRDRIQSKIKDAKVA
jgi:predicted small metal-binding protein